MEQILRNLNEKKDAIFNMYIYLLIFMTIFLSRNTLVNSCILNFNMSFLILFILYIPLFIKFFFNILKNGLDYKKILVIFFMIIMMLFSMILKKDFQLYNFSILYYIIASTVLILSIDFNKFKTYYVNILVLFAIASLVVTYIIKPLIFYNNWDKMLEGTIFITTNSVNYKFLNLGLSFAFFDVNYDRNYGIFTEPSFYQFYLITAIILLIFDKKIKLKEWIKILILTITAYTTKSAIGIVIILLIAIIKIIQFIIEHKKEHKKIILFVLGLVILVIGILSIKSVQENLKFVYSKFITSNESSQSRFGSFEYTISKFASHPICGNKLIDIITYEKHLTNTTITMGAIYGVIPFLCLIYCSAKLAKKIQSKLIISICILCIFVLAYNSHLYIGVQSFWLLNLLGFANTIEKERNILDGK